MKMLLGLVFVATLNGCGPFVPVVHLDPESSRQLRKEVSIYDPSELQIRQFKRIGSIQATSCMNKIWDSPSSQEDAIDQLRYKAATLGANGVTSLVCEPREGTNLNKNCWNSVTCYGVAVTVGERTASLAEINEVYRRVDRMWQLEYQKTEDEFRYRVVEADYETTFQAARKAFIELRMPVQKASTETGVVLAENNAPAPLTKEEWVQVIKIENQNPSLPEIAGRRFQITEDPSAWVVIIRVVLRKVSSNKTFVLLEYELDVPRFRGTGVEPNKQAPPLAVQAASTKFWSQLSHELEKVNVPSPRRRNRDEFAI